MILLRTIAAFFFAAAFARIQQDGGVFHTRNSTGAGIPIRLVGLDADAHEFLAFFLRSFVVNEKVTVP